MVDLSKSQWQLNDIIKVKFIRQELVYEEKYKCSQAYEHNKDHIFVEQFVLIHIEPP